MVKISITKYKNNEPKRLDTIGQRARFKITPQRPGWVVQSVRAFAFIDGAVERYMYTEAWRIHSSKKIEQSGDDDFMVPKQWIRDHSGQLYIIAYAWYQKVLDDDFVRGNSDQLWGRLMGTPYIKLPPDGAQVLERIWRASWTNGGAVTFDVLQ